MINFTVKMTAKDLGMKEALERLSKERPNRVKVGVLAKSGSDRVKIAATQEFGSPSKKIPSRSYIRNTVILNQNKYEAILRRGAVAVTEGVKTKDQILEALGAMVVSDIKSMIATGKVRPQLDPNGQTLKRRKRRERLAKKEGRKVGDLALLKRRKRLAKKEGRKVGDFALLDRGDLLRSINRQVVK